MTITGWIFMSVSVSAVLAWNVWCFWRLFRRKPHVTHIPDV